MGLDSDMPATPANLAPDRIAGYTVIRELSPGSLLVINAGGRRLVLKPLPADCLLAGQLHPLVRDRLAHVRGLAHGSLANLHGVERDGDRVYMVWDFVEGLALADLRADIPSERAASVSERCSAKGRDRFLMVAARRIEVERAVESLHALGVVHGAIKPGNVIIAADGAVRLIHVSPLLYHDPQIDRAAIDALFEGRDAQPTDGGMAAELAEDLAASRSVRRRSLAGAAATAAAGLLLAGGLWHFARQVTGARSAAPAHPPATMPGGDR